MYQCGRGETTDYGTNLDDCLRQEGVSVFRKDLGLASSVFGLVQLRTSLVQVSLGTPHVQSCSMLRLLTPLMSLKLPPSPQQLPQEFLIIQYLTPFSSPQPVTEMSWSSAMRPVLSTKIPPVQLRRASVTAMRQVMGPRWQISFMMAASPLTDPYSSSPQIFALSCAQHPLLGMQFLHMISEEQPTPLSWPYAWQGEQVQSVILLWKIHQNASLVSPPSHPLPLSVQEMITCGERLTSGHCAFLLILIRSEMDEVVAKAQQLPQYMGIC